MGLESQVSKNNICIWIGRSLVDFGLKTPWTSHEEVDDDISQTTSSHFESLSDRHDFVTSIISLLSPHLILASPSNLHSGENSVSTCLEADERLVMFHI